MQRWRVAANARALWPLIRLMLRALPRARAVWIAFFAVYFYYSSSDVELSLMGGVFLAKIMVECWGQDTPTWVAPGTVLTFLFTFVGFVPFIVYINAYCRQAVDLEFQGQRWVALLLYFLGTTISLSYELHRFWWKRQPENKGKLHTVFSAAFVIHPNYFGDLLTWTGWGLATGTICAMQFPCGMLFWLWYIFAANSDAYLAQRYPDQFPEYSSKTPSFLPFVPPRVEKVLGHVTALAGLAGFVFTSLQCSAACGTGYYVG